MGFIFIASCKSKKNITSNLPEKGNRLSNEQQSLMMFLKGIKEQENTFNYIGCKGECEYSDGKNTYNFDVQVEMEKDKFIFLRATYLLGIEVAKLYITPSQIQIVNHLERSNTVAGYSYLKKFSNANITFNQLENVFIGNAIFNQDTTSSKLDSTLSEYIIKTMVDGALQQSLYDKNTVAKLKESSLTDLEKNQTLQVKYSQYIQNATNYYPSELAINISAEKKLSCLMKLSNFAFVKKKDPNIRVPASYKTISY